MEEEIGSNPVYVSVRSRPPVRKLQSLNWRSPGLENRQPERVWGFKSLLQRLYRKVCKLAEASGP